MSMWKVVFEINDKHYTRCLDCPFCRADENCKLQDKDFPSFGYQLMNCPLEEVVE